MSTIKIATSYAEEHAFYKWGTSDNVVSNYPVMGYMGTRTIAKLEEGRTYNFTTKVVNEDTNYPAVIVANGNKVSRQFEATGEDQNFSITLGVNEDTLYINNSEGVKVVVFYEQEADFDPKPVAFNSPQPFRFWCQTVMPLVYDDSLSYYELLSKVVKYINSLIKDITNVENLYTNLTNAYTELEAYVNTYFDNLDVSEAINQKLDYMAEHGDFDALVAEALQRINYTAIINAEVDSQLPSVVDTKIGDVVANQIDASVASQIGGAVASEIDGAVGEQIGASVADQIGGVVADQIDASVATQINAVVASQIGSVVGEQIDASVAGQIGASVADQITPIVGEQVAEQIGTAVSNWLARNFTTPPVDKSLTIGNAAADAKITGTALDYLKDISIDGYSRKEEEVPTITRFNSDYFVQLTNSIGFVAGDHDRSNSACVTNLIGGGRYKIVLNGDFSSVPSPSSAGWLCNNVVVPTRYGAVTATIVAKLEDYIGSLPNGEYYIDLPYNADAIIFNSLNDTICNCIKVTMDFEKAEETVVPASIEGYQNQSIEASEILWNSRVDASGNIVIGTSGYAVGKFTLPETDFSQDIKIYATGISSEDIAVQVRDENSVLTNYYFTSIGAGQARFNSTITVPANAKYVWVCSNTNIATAVTKANYNGYVWKGMPYLTDEPNQPNDYFNEEGVYLKPVVLYDNDPQTIEEGWIYYVVDSTTHEVIKTIIY